MFGCHFMDKHEQDPAIKAANGWGDFKNDSVPFHHVYIHALVRDADRQKMSKTKGNVIDPLDIIERFGTDAVRFTLAAMAAPGTDIAFSESRTDGYRAFANKIWNAARFMFMNVDRIKPRRLPATGETSVALHGFPSQPLEDRWIFSLFNRVAKDVNEALGTYRFHEAANRIYDFFWGSLCDWYLELIKARLNFEDGTDRSTAEAACQNLVMLFDASLRLLHPFMPFITEEIWHAMYDGNPPLKSIALAGYPDFDDTKVDLDAEFQMAILQDLIVNVRNLRAELKVEGKMKVPIAIFASDAFIQTMIEKNRASVERLANVESILFAEASFANLRGGRSTARFDVHVIYERKIDVAAECERLKKELDKMEKEFANNQRQLWNEQFLAKAPEKVVEGLRNRAGELSMLIEKAKDKMEDLGCK